MADPNSPAKHNPKWTDHKQSDPGMANRTASIAVSPSAEPVESVVLELAGIVVLCAKEEKEKFEKEWARYVKHHALKGKALQKTIKDVSDQAAAQRDSESDDAKWIAERRKLMNDVARQILGPSAR